MKKHLVISFADNSQTSIAAREIAYKVETRSQLMKLNEIFSAKETRCPALYINFFGMLTPEDLTQEQPLKNIGYRIVTI